MSRVKAPKPLPFTRRVLFTIACGPEARRVFSYLQRCAKRMRPEGFIFNVVVEGPAHVLEVPWTYNAGCIFQLEHNEYPSIGLIRRLAWSILRYGDDIASVNERLIYNHEKKMLARAAPTTRFMCYRPAVFRDPSRSCPGTRFLALRLDQGSSPSADDVRVLNHPDRTADLVHDREAGH